jgi:hypothetical protein
VVIYFKMAEEVNPISAIDSYPRYLVYDPDRSSYGADGFLIGIDADVTPTRVDVTSEFPVRGKDVELRE